MTLCCPSNTTQICSSGLSHGYPPPLPGFPVPHHHIRIVSVVKPHARNAGVLLVVRRQTEASIDCSHMACRNSSQCSAGSNSPRADLSSECEKLPQPLDQRLLDALRPKGSIEIAAVDLRPCRRGSPAPRDPGSWARGWHGRRGSGPGARSRLWIAAATRQGCSPRWMNRAQSSARHAMKPSSTSARTCSQSLRRLRTPARSGGDGRSTRRQSGPTADANQRAARHDVEVRTPFSAASLRVPVPRGAISRPASSDSW